MENTHNTKKEIKKYLFDANFFDQDDALIPPEEEMEESLEEAPVFVQTPPPPPTYSQAEMDQAKAAKFEEGKAEGMKSAEDSVTRQVLATLQSLQSQILNLTQDEQGRQERFEHDSFSLALDILKQTFPMLNEKLGQDIVKDKLQTILSGETRIQALKVITSTAMKAPLEEHFSTQESAQVTIESCEAIADLDCRVEWESGGVVIDRSSLIDKTLEIMQQLLEENDRTGHDDGESSISQQEAQSHE